MDNDNQNNDSLSEGFLVKGRDGKFRKIKDDRTVDLDFSSPVSPSVAAQPVVQPAKPAILPPSGPRREPAPAAVFSPRPPISSSPKAAFVVEPEDEEEIRQHSQQLEEMKNKLPVSQLDPLASIDLFISQLVSRHNLQFENEVLKQRFYKIIESCFREIRNAIELEEILIRAKKIGGLEMNKESASRVAAEVEREFRKVGGLAKEPPKMPKPADSVLTEGAWAEKPQTKMPAPPPSFVPRPGQPVQSAKPADFPTASVKSIPPLEVKPAPEAMPPAAPEKPAAPMPPEKSEPPEKHEEFQQFYQPAAADDMSRIAKARQAASQRPQLVDIKKPDHLVGPVEEIGEIDLKEFRRLGSSPAESAAKIAEKFSLLEEESWQMRIDGLDAWRACPLHQLYVALGLESLRSGKTVDEVIKSSDQPGQPKLLLEEFLAINSLNSELRI